jgi:hypothetical protein
MDDYRDRVAWEARRIKDRLMDGALYGVYVNIGNIDLAIVAAYYLGLYDGEKTSYPKIGRCRFSTYNGEDK